jgi:hypothetical protein
MKSWPPWLTVAHVIKARPVIGLTRSTVAQSGKKLLYLVTSGPRTVAQNRSRILRTFYELRKINFEWFSVIVVANIQLEQVRVFPEGFSQSFEPFTTQEVHHLRYLRSLFRDFVENQNKIIVRCNDETIYLICLHLGRLLTFVCINNDRFVLIGPS